MRPVVFGMLVASGRITMLGLSRWTEKGGSYRTLQRFYQSILPWGTLHWLFVRKRFLKPDDEYLIAGDEVVVSKAGTKTYFATPNNSGGLEDCMNVQETAVTNAANLSFFMVNLRYALLQPVRQTQPDYSVLDLKAQYRGGRYASETIKMLPQKPDAILLADIFQQIAQLGAIHPVVQPSASP